MATRGATPWLLARQRAGRQDDIVSLAQCLQSGLTAGAVRHAERSGRITRRGIGIYSMSAAPLTPRARCWRALLRGGSDSALSHRTAGVSWAVLKDHGRFVHLTSPRHLRAVDGELVHQAPLLPGDITTRDGLRVTSLARTLLDLAATEPEVVLLVAVRQALTLHRGRRRSIFAMLARAGGHAGRGPLRRALRALAADPGRGEVRGSLEDSFWLAMKPWAALLPPYVRNQQIRLPGGEVFLGDVVFTRERVVVELDARDHHDNDPSFDSDRRRDLRLAAAGWIVVRVTPRHLREDIAAVATDLLALLAARR